MNIIIKRRVMNLLKIIGIIEVVALVFFSFIAISLTIYNDGVLKESKREQELKEKIPKEYRDCYLDFYDEYATLKRIVKREGTWYYVYTYEESINLVQIPGQYIEEFVCNIGSRSWEIAVVEVEGRRYFAMPSSLKNQSKYGIGKEYQEITIDLLAYKTKNLIYNIRPADEKLYEEDGWILEIIWKAPNGKKFINKISANSKEELLEKIPENCEVEISD